VAHADPVISDLRPSAEVALILACCRWPRSDERNAAIRRAAAAPIDWQRFMAMTAKHRVDGFVHEGLLAGGIEAPDDVRAALPERGRAIASRSLVLAATNLMLADMFDAAGIRALFIKGSSLELLAFGELGLKSAHDIDMLIDRADFMAASEVVGAAGWIRMVPPVNLRDDLLDPFLDHCKDAIFVHEVNGIHLELHHRLGWHEALDQVGAGSPRQEVELLPGKTVPTLANEDLFIYLAIHGASHQWGRLKWLTDVAGLLTRFTTDEIDALHAAACRRGAGQVTGQTLSLCHDLLGTALSPALRAELVADRRIPRFYAASLAALEETRTRGDSLADVFEGLKLEMQMRPDWRSRLKTLRRYLISQSDLTLLPLPRRLFFLYYLARLPLFVVRRAFL
jgi:hypothetical protein